MTLETIALIQFTPSLGPANDGTLQRLCEQLRSAASSDVDLLICPELTTTGYSIFDDIAACAEPIPGPTTQAIGTVAGETNTHVLFGMAVDTATDVYNSAMWIDRTGSVAARYDKRNLWGDERNAFTPGDDALVVDCEDRQVGVQICYDLNFPRLSAVFARTEIDILANISAWSAPMANDWNRLLPARAIENGAYVVGCNRTGIEADTKFYGHSTVYEPDGTVANRLSDKPGILVGHIQEELLTNERSRNPMREDRQSDRPGVQSVSI